MTEADVDGGDLGDIRPVADASPKAHAGETVIAKPSAFKNGWAERFPDPLIATASGWTSTPARARQVGVAASCHVPPV